MQISHKFVAAAAIVGLLPLAGFAQDLPKTELSVIGSPVNSPNWTNVLQPFWNETIPADSNGQVTADAVSMTDLGVKGPELMRLAASGVADIIAGSTTLISGELAENDSIDLAGLAQDIDTLQQVIEVYRPVLEERYRERLDVVPLGFWPTGAQVLWCATPVTSLDDLTGKKVRVFSTTTSSLTAALGATPVTMAFNEVVPALQRGVIDCAFTGSNSGNNAKWTDVATHLVDLTVGWGVNFIVANSTTWDGLDPAVQEFLRTEIREKLEPVGWEMARVATQQGIWCSVGDDRCEPEATAPRNLTKSDLTLVELTDAENEHLRAIVAENVMPEFTQACGADCVQRWNETVGEVVDIELDPAR
ncbi:TRAP transporter substrate-binding protein [Martelella limonii]|uniref:TRAP transporter substrate-binding protein n=1 Tax=Martelella limonii TaxID=1647649 RepID=UPI00157FF40B|nr:TRAP transporter substrate-binding protein [Martelella limonii]